MNRTFIFGVLASATVFSRSVLAQDVVAADQTVGQYPQQQYPQQQQYVQQQYIEGDLTDGGAVLPLDTTDAVTTDSLFTEQEDIASVRADATAIAIARAQEEARLDAEARLQAEAEAKAEAELDSRRMHTRVFKLSHANAETVANNLNATWSGEFGTNWRLVRIATAFPESNSVLITAPKRILDACEEVLRKRRSWHLVPLLHGK